jgi:cytochrome d ubiquinol oxidase subunit I
MVIGDLHGLNTLEHQPAKIAAMEAHWETQRGAPMVLFAIPDENAETNRFEVAIPALASLYLTHSLDGEVRGLKEWPAQDRPPVLIPFLAFRIMVGIGLVMLAVVAAGAWLRYRGRLFDTPWFLGACLLSSPLGFIAVIAGWFTTEVGRQPWLVYNLLRTRDSVPPSLTGADVLLSLAVYVVAYIFVFGAGLILLARLVRSGVAAEPPTAIEPARGSSRPLSAVVGDAEEEGAR